MYDFSYNFIVVMTIVRSQYSELKSRLEEPRRFIQVIAGPRQVGKTTLVEQVLSDISIPYSKETADSATSSDREWINRVWEAARATTMLNGNAEHLLVIDEVQKIDNWSEAVKKEWDADTWNGVNLKVVLLGSSRLLLKKGLTESLAGRFEMIKMGHWSYQEMKDAFGFTLDQYVYFGGFPGSANMISNESRWRKYMFDALIAPSIEKDVIMTSNIYKPALMDRLFALGCSYSAEIMSLTKMIGQLKDAGNVTTLANYLTLLEQSNLLTGLQKYSKNILKKYNSIPKYQVYNNAFLTAYKGRSFTTDRSDPTIWGRWVESAVGAHLMNMSALSDFRVYYWRDGDNEVDYVIERVDKCVAIEVKSGRKGMNSGLPKFKGLFHPKSSLVVGSQGMRLEDFLSADVGELLR